MMFAIALSLLAALPIVQRPALSNAPTDHVAIMISGDGGWRPIDVGVTEPLRKQGIPVVGFLSNRYFGKRRTPEEAAHDLELIIRDAMQRYGKHRLLLIGFSRGADVLPFLANRLPDDLRKITDVVALLGTEPTIDFKYHPSWIPFYHPHEPQFPVAPEIEKLRGMRILCVYGSREKHALCPTLDPTLVTVLRESGGHHFGGHYDEIAAAILRTATISAP